ncbi:MAG: peptidyl-prolyl cis-trans isomerase, partial [Planctomycetes bacterium]|nr:peptidyl-prolyl cis-trans isomerase [Planctomycetota bacterium]
DTPKALITRAQEVARRLREPTTDGLSWETAADVSDPTGTFVRRRELGWMKELDFFHLGAHPEEAAKGLAVGGTSELLQEGAKLMILRLDARREPRTRPLAEVRDAIFRKLGNPRLAAAQRRIEAEILAAQEIVLAAEGGGS